MKYAYLRFASSLALSFLGASFSGCTSNQNNPDEIRQRTAEATETVRRDAKAMAEGVKEGMSSDKAININNASREDLLNLPGITQGDADRIIAERPFKGAHELVARHIIPESEYDKIRDRIIAGH
ncbi:MAG: helix-hairpin-helix domain-containing protein [Candidatus Sulfotelmatobacter sp.]|jgi:DNA uptake protein ComE-like DNA-binding protein